MNGYNFTFRGVACTALPSGGLYMPDYQTLCVSDLHLGKSERIARRSGTMLPPYEIQDTLEKLQKDIDKTSAKTIICLGDSFDDLTAAHSLPDDAMSWVGQLQAGREWIWIEGNHDAGPVALAGSHMAQFRVGGIVFRHIATDTPGEISGHYHPKHTLAGRSKPAFIYDQMRLIMPAYGTYTGGLHSYTPVLRQLFDAPPIAILTGRKAIAVPITKTRHSPQYRDKSC